jgi:AcrR family transcriptional regulator
MPKGIRLTEEEQSLRRREIFNAAVSLFLEQGFQETSMREIAEAAGMGKSSLYDYFRTKDEILLFVIEEETGILTKQAQAIASQAIAPDERLRQIMQLHLAFLQENQNLFLRLSAEAQRLKAESQKSIQERRYAYQDLVAGIIKEGIASGSFRKVNALNAARLLINSLLSALYTSRPTGSVEEMLDEMVAIFLNGLKT